MAKTLTSGDNWKQLVAEKEQEWYKAYQLRVQALEKSCDEKTTKLESLEKKYSKLKEFFEYNIQLISQRDKELDRFEIMVKDLSAKLNVANVELSEGKIREDEWRRQLAEFDKSQTELRMHFQQRLREKQAEIDNYRIGKESKLDQERKEYEDLKRKLGQQILKAEESFELQKRELSISFDDALKKREHEFRLKMDEMNNALKAEQIKVKISAKELELLKANQQEAENSLNIIESNQQELEKTLKQKEWEIKDLNASHQVRQAELEAHVSAVSRNKDKIQEDFHKKFNEMDSNLRQKVCDIEKLRSALVEQEKAHILAISDLQSENEMVARELANLKTTLAEKDHEKNAEIKRLEKELENVHNEMESQKKKASQSYVRREIEVQEIKEDKVKMNVYIQELKDTIERYQKDLNAAIEREALLEQSKSQLNIDWQKRYESAEREGFQKSESLVQKLTKARDEALATVKEQKRILDHRGKSLRIMELEKNKAYEILSSYNIEIPEQDKMSSGNLEVNSDLTEELFSLREQNTNLRSVIKEMRQQMSEIEKTQQVSPKRNAETHNTVKKTLSVSEEYVHSLENALKDLKKENRTLKLNLPNPDKEVSPEIKMPGELNLDQIANISDNTVIRTHIQSLNQALGDLKKEKTELLAHARKQQVRITFLEERLKASTEQPQKKQIALDQLKYELNVNMQRSQAEINSLKKQIAELELQLTEARGAADEYHRANLENNIEITTLRNEVSSLKVELSEKRPTLNFGAQELTIQQLQEEILNLRQRAAKLTQNDQEPTYQRSVSSDNDSYALVAKLQTKLSDSVKHIATISQDRQRLIDHSNRLQSELNKIKMNYGLFNNNQIPANNGLSSLRSPDSGDVEIANGRLPELEDLHYKLTKQELQYAQKYQAFPSKPSQINDLPVRDEPVLYSDTLKVMADNQIQQPRSYLLRSSSEGGQSLFDVWKLLEETSTISSVPPIQATQASETLTADEEVKLAEKSKTSFGSKLKKKSQGSKKTQKLKIRNYNFKDDDAL